MTIYAANNLAMENLFTNLNMTSQEFKDNVKLRRKLLLSTLSFDYPCTNSTSDHLVQTLNPEFQLDCSEGKIIVNLENTNSKKIKI